MTESKAHAVAVGGVRFGNDLPLALIAGPCAMESRDHALEMASALKEIAGAARHRARLQDRPSTRPTARPSASARGIGLDEAPADLRRGQASDSGCRSLTDVHEIEQCAPVAEVVDILQIPAFLCRQTDLLRRRGAAPGASSTSRRASSWRPGTWPTSSPRSPRAGNPNVMVTERGASFGYNTLVVRHARPADHGRDDRRAGDLRRHPFGAAARRQGHDLRRPARVRAGAGAGRGRGRRRRRLHRDPSRSRPGAVRRPQHGAAQGHARAARGAAGVRSRSPRRCARLR